MPLATAEIVDALSARVAEMLVEVRRPVLLLTDQPLGLADHERGIYEAPPGVDVSPPYKTVVLVAVDPAGLRLAVSALPRLGWARLVGCVVAGSTHAIAPRIGPGWPALWNLQATHGGPHSIAATLLRFAGRLDAAEVLLALGRAAGRDAPRGNDGTFVAGPVELPVDPSYAPIADPDSPTPPDVVVGSAPPAHEGGVLARPPRVIAPTSPRAHPGALVVDEGLFSPIGFRPTWLRGVVELPEGERITPALVAALRDAQAVRTPSDVVATTRLSMAGVLCLEVGPDAVVPLDLDDPVSREEHSIRTRRGVLLRHASAAWRARAAGRSWPVVRPGWEVEGGPTEHQLIDLLLAAHYSGADEVWLPDDTGPTECYASSGPGTDSGLPVLRRHEPRSGHFYRGHHRDRG